MKPSRKLFASTAALAGLVAIVAFGGLTTARADEPCVELKLSGNQVLEIPCPEEFGRLLDSPFLQPRPGDDSAMAIDPEMAIDPQWPHDQAMVAERDWPYDWAMIVPRADEGKDAVPLFDDLLGLLDKHLSRQPEGRPPSKRYLDRAGYGELPE